VADSSASTRRQRAKRLTGTVRLTAKSAKYMSSEIMRRVSRVLSHNKKGWRWFRSVFLFVVLGGCFPLAATSALAAAQSGPCSASPEGRQLDFWLGDWTVISRHAR